MKNFANPTRIHTSYSSREEELANRKKDCQAFEDICNKKFHLRGISK